ncbi:MAG: methyltransferase domain-containing protein [Candidatus Limivivens sp.]|nr:methyltransferase domain-containing protein [Candidatus Limivivens sp.]
MENSKFEEIKEGKDLRTNLIDLKKEIKDEGKKRSLAYELEGDYSVFVDLLNHQDPKVRKNAALILGEMECQELTEPLFEAYRREETLFVRSAYLKALEAYDCQELVPELKICLEELDTREVPEEEAKHRREEAGALQRLLLKQEKQKKHRFTGFDERLEVILLTNRQQRDVTAALVEEKEAAERMAMLAGGVRILTSRLRKVCEIRTWSEMLFPIPGLKHLPEDPGEGAKELAQPLVRFLKRVHEGSFPFRFRLELRQKKGNNIDSSYIKRLAAELETASKRELVNAAGDYEVDLRLLESRQGGWIPVLKLSTLADRRFLYRSQVIAASIAPWNAALFMELARPWLKSGAQVLDPFCGVGTMLVERAKRMPADPLYGLDIYEEAVQKGRENAGLAGIPIHFVNRDALDFKHEYLFDEIVSNMPGIGRTRDKGQILDLYERFLNRLPVLLKKDGILVLYTPEPEVLRWCLESHEDLAILKEALINEREGSRLFVLRYGAV